MRLRWFDSTFMPGLHSRRDSMRQYKNESDGCIRLIFHTLDLFSSRLKALGDMLVNHSPVKGNKNVSTLSRNSRRRVWMSTFVRNLSRSHIAKSLDEYPRQECKPGIKDFHFLAYLWQWRKRATVKLNH